MPPTKFGRTEVLDAALQIVRERGHEVLSARAVAERAGCSVQPIYSLFGDMNGLMQALYEHARAWVTDYNARHAHDGVNLFASNGLAHLRLAREEPQLFAFLYLSPYLGVRSLADLYASVSQPGVEECIVELGHLSPESAREFYLNMIVFTHGLAVMLASGAHVSDEELSERVMAAFRAFAQAADANPTRGAGGGAAPQT